MSLICVISKVACSAHFMIFDFHIISISCTVFFLVKVFPFDVTDKC